MGAVMLLNMKRVAIASLLMLCGCQKKDPADLLRPDSKVKYERFALEDIAVGDSHPFKLSGGAYSIDGGPQVGCDGTATIQLKKYADHSIVFEQTARVINFRLSNLSRGIYYFMTQTESGCPVFIYVNKEP